MRKINYFIIIMFYIIIIAGHVSYPCISHAFGPYGGIYGNLLPIFFGTTSTTTGYTGLLGGLNYSYLGGLYGGLYGMNYLRMNLLSNLYMIAALNQLNQITTTGTNPSNIFSLSGLYGSTGLYGNAYNGLFGIGDYNPYAVMVMNNLYPLLVLQSLVKNQTQNQATATQPTTTNSSNPTASSLWYW